MRRSARIAAIVIDGREYRPALVFLTLYIGLAGLPLCMQRVEILLKSLCGRLAGVDCAARFAATAGGSRPRRPRQGDRLEATFHSRISRRHRAEEAEAAADFRKGSGRPNLSDRRQQDREEGQSGRRAFGLTGMSDPTSRNKEFESEIRRLPDLSLDDLRARWKALFGNPAPLSLRRRFLARAVAYQMHEYAVLFRLARLLPLDDALCRSSLCARFSRATPSLGWGLGLRCSCRRLCGSS
jgi:hypothetical protein